MVPVIVAVLFAFGCAQRADERFASPAATFRTYQRALRQRDWDLLWSCYSQSFRKNLSGGRAAWEQKWRDLPLSAVQAELQREIAEEKEIDGGIGYLLFYKSSLPRRGDSPFFYFVRERGGWHLTSHLDAVFHQRLEKAIQHGALKFPDPD